MQRFRAEMSAFDGADRDRFLYYKDGDAWVCTEFVQSFDSVDQGTVRALNGKLLMSPGDGPRWSVEEYHANRCVQHEGRWFVALQEL